MKNLPIGLEIYSVREAFMQSPELALKKVSDIGYNCVEFTTDTIKKFEANRIKEALENAELTCCGCLTGWSDMQHENIEDTLRKNEDIGNKVIAIGSAPYELLKNRRSLEQIIAHMNQVNEIAKDSGFRFGYHCHQEDFVMVDGVSAWEHIMDSTPDDFLMVLDTGNALGGQAWSVPTIKRHPGRAPWVHIKPYDLEHLTYDTMIGEDSFDWKELIETCVNVGGTEILTVEYGRRNRYEPFYGAKLCYDRLMEIINE